MARWTLDANEISNQRKVDSRVATLKLIANKCCRVCVEGDGLINNVGGNVIQYPFFGENSEGGQCSIQTHVPGHLGGSVVEHLPLAQVMILGSWDQVLCRAPYGEPASPSTYVSVSLCVSH